MAEKKIDKKSDSGVEVKDREKVKKPKRYSVVFYNDNYTPMEYVILLLMQEFHLSSENATAVMMKIHNSERGAVGSYSREIAETKASICNVTSRQMGYPLLCDIEPE